MKNFLLILFLIFFISCSTVPKNVSTIETQKEEKIIKEEVRTEREAVEKIEKTKIADMEYKIKKGDTLTKLAKEYYGNVKFWKKIASDNNLKTPYILKENSILIIKRSKDLKLKETFTYPIYMNRAFGIGEKLVFAVKYFNITAGFGILDVKDMTEINGRKVYRIEAIARTSPFFETFYRVRDIITSYMDVKGLFSWKYSKHLEEGGYRHDSFMEFFHKEGYAQKSDGSKCDIPAFVQDVLSEFYYFRATYKGEDEFYINVASDECKFYQILVKKLRYEKVTVDAGEFDCVVIQPFLKYEGIFRQKGDIWIWLTNDERLMPVLVKSQIVIGTIDAVLQSATVIK